MPDLLTHYAVSLLIASRVLKLRYAAIAALAGLLPDVDALLRIHRAGTHSLLLAGLAAVPILVITIRLGGRRYLTVVAVAMLLYIFHIVLDIFTAPVPLLWPLSNNAYMVRITTNGLVTTNTITVLTDVKVMSTAINMKTKTEVEGPIVTNEGIMISLMTFTVLTLEKLIIKEKQN